MKAARFTGVKAVKVEEVDMPHPGPNDALVKLQASALCRSDLYRYYGTSCFEGAEEEPNWIPGHEPSGIVEKVGDQVSCVKPGDRVGLFMFTGCGKCQLCRQGNIMLCEKFGCIGFSRDGAHADYIVIPAENCLHIPDEMDFVTAALLTDVGGGLYTACRTLGVNGSTNVVIVGAGPMGCGGVLMAKGFGGKVTVIDLDDKRLDFAKSIGADYAVNPGKCDINARIEEMTNGRGADITIECTGSEAGANTALDLVKPLGKVGIIGENSRCTIDPSAQIIHKKLTIYGCWVFNKHDWPEIVDFVLENKIRMDVLATHKYKINDVSEAYEKFDAHEAQKVVFIWD
jgi:propanol-preferring alcohol dehydrogenase